MSYQSNYMIQAAILPLNYRFTWPLTSNPDKAVSSFFLRNSIKPFYPFIQPKFSEKFCLFFFFFAFFLSSLPFSFALQISFPRKIFFRLNISYKNSAPSKSPAILLGFKFVGSNRLFQVAVSPALSDSYPRPPKQIFYAFIAGGRSAFRA